VETSSHAVSKHHNQVSMCVKRKELLYYQEV
jgi:hypothetical protein